MNRQVRRSLLVPVLASWMSACATVALAAEDDVRGKVIDRSAVRVDGVAPNAERLEPAGSAASDVRRRDFEIMRETIASVPVKPATRTVTVSDAAVGANFVSGRDDLLPEARATLDRIAGEWRNRRNIRVLVVGHTDNQRLSAETRRQFSHNQALSEARAFAVAQYLRSQLGLPAESFTIRGDGDTKPVADNGTPEGMARNRRVEIQVWHDQTVVEPAPPAAPPKTVERRELAERSACPPTGRDEPVPFRITVDGVPLASDGKVSEADRQRCADVALNRADIQVKYDPLQVAPALNVTVYPTTVVRGRQVTFSTYSNYAAWIAKGEIRVFEKGRSTQQAPLAVIPAPANGTVEWKPEGAIGAELFFLLRVYDRDGRFDETASRRIDITDWARPEKDGDERRRELLTGYGESSLRLRNIPVAGGSVTVSGSGIREGQVVTALGIRPPIDRDGKFALRQIFPAGPHTVVVSVTEPDGRGTEFRRNLTIADRDWFYVAVADITAGRNSVTGPANIVTADTQHYENRIYVDGRAAFYLKGKIKGEYLITASADTQEQPLQDLFSNFARKDPRYLLRRLDPNRFYPVYGDDSTTLEDAPTQGKFFVRVDKDDSHVMWGNFQTRITGTEFAQYNRALYGLRAQFNSPASTTFGERRTQVEGFAADPGTVQSREEFRGTGGSLYFLRHQDLTIGAERVWIEVRDKDSGIVIQAKPLVFAQDYEINYFQGRILLREALSSVSGASTLVQTASLAGHPMYLVVTYEYVPGITAINNLSYGGRVAHWFGDHVRLGMTGFRQGEAGAEQTLKGFDATLRYKPGTYLKAEAARSDGPGSGALSSATGGFDFNRLGSAGQNAGAQRIEAAVDLSEVSNLRGRANIYWQERGQGFSGPGQINVNGEAITQRGAALQIPLTESTTVIGKADDRSATSQSVQSVELGVRQRLNPNWTAGIGLRADDRNTTIVNASPLLSQSGARTDVVARIEFKPTPAELAPADGNAPAADPKALRHSDWDAYGYVQGTADKTGNRSDNSRLGVGGGYRLTDRFRLTGEVSEGYGGVGGKLGGEYRFDDRRSMYVNYLSETDRTDTAFRGRATALTAGSRYRFSDSASAFTEERLTRGAGPSGLTHAYGLDLAPNDRWTYGLKYETGTISDPLSGDFKRHAFAATTGYQEGKTKYAGAFEYRHENSVAARRDTIVVRNSLGYQIDPAWRALGRLNFATSSSSTGDAFAADFSEVVGAFAYRPVNNDKWNTLFKYTYFFNVPSPGQVGLSNVALDYAQRSHIVSVDTIYDVRPWVSVGFKYGMRYGELKASKTDGPWLSSAADLLILRADFHWVREWDALVEVRRLGVRSASDARNGVLLGLYRHVDNNVKVGVGYNFTDFSSDLTDQSYRSRGWFVNLLSKF